MEESEEHVLDTDTAFARWVIALAKFDQDFCDEIHQGRIVDLVEGWQRSRQELIDTRASATRWIAVVLAMSLVDVFPAALFTVDPATSLVGILAVWTCVAAALRRVLLLAGRKVEQAKTDATEAVKGLSSIQRKMTAIANMPFPDTVFSTSNTLKN